MDCPICGTGMKEIKLTSKVSSKTPWKEKRSQKGKVYIMFKCHRCGKILTSPKIK
jgi:hypothetical protein